MKANEDLTAQEQTIDEFFANLDREKMAAVKRTRLDLLEEEMKANIRHLREQATGPRPPTVDGVVATAVDTSLAVRREIANNALLLTKEGLPAETVAEYLRSSLNSLGGSVGATGPIGVTDIAGLITAISNALKPTGNGGDSEIKALLKQLADNSTREQNTTLRALFEQTKALMEEIKIMKASGGAGAATPTRGKVKVIKPDFTIVEVEEGEPIIIREPAPAASGEPIDVIRERNRHAEKMEEIKDEKEHKRDLRKLASDIPERIGRGVGEQIRKSGMEAFECSNCGATIYITPETGETITCGKCRMSYKREKEDEQQPG